MAQPVHAQSWVDVGDGFYVDRDSAKRNGDIATVWLRHVSQMDVIAEVTFDCKNGLAISKSTTPTPTKNNMSLLKGQEIACRRPWELWK